MKERPILFSGPMVRALLAGTKTQTRRVVKNQPPRDVSPISVSRYHPTVIDRHGDEQPGAEIFGAYSDDGDWGSKCQFGDPCDRLWVRETTRSRFIPNIFTGEPTTALCGEYAADSEPVLNEAGFDIAWWYSRRSCPAIHMPRWASRITLEITGVRVERLQDISEADALAEGIRQHDQRNGWVNECTLADGKRHFDASAYGMFQQLWADINGAESWDANPWVWVVEFRRLSA